MFVTLALRSSKERGPDTHMEVLKWPPGGEKSNADGTGDGRVQ